MKRLSTESILCCRAESAVVKLFVTDACWTSSPALCWGRLCSCLFLCSIVITVKFFPGVYPATPGFYLGLLSLIDMVNSSFLSSVNNSSLFVYSIKAKSLANNSWALETARKQAFKPFKVLFRNNTALAIYTALNLFVSWLFRLCNWLGLFSKLFKTSHLLKSNCFQAGVINGVLCLLLV